ncbi:hypothetical protein EHR01_04075 [Leptospira mtsangambouensis]|uniref:1-aminocyclopropane-1-carboxylate deaminase n=2 Tax=Leptospira mtsangambouensis TaxID=2484912 RepID=A0ABY2P4Y6_9LEPT|nr:hypothetical protein EHR01_04075 [Leptospira mtsangambouensis]
MDPSRFFPSLPIHISEIPFTILDSFVSKAEKTARSLDTPSIPTLHFIRDDLLPFGFGTKWRKTQGILQYLQKNRIQKVLLWGAIHGNYLASFTTILRKNGFTVDTIAYTRDPHLRSYNERLVRGHSHTLVCYANRKVTFDDWLAKEKEYQGLSLPEFGIHSGQNLGLRSFWQEIEKKIIQFLDTSQPKFQRHKINAILRMEIGSGATFLSAFDFFYGTSLLVQGVMVGENKETWQKKTEDLQKQLGLKIIPIPTEQILEIPKEGKNSEAHLQFDNNRNKTTVSFGKQSKSQKEWIREFYRNTNILLEPIYSGMTVKPLLRELNEMQITTMSKPLPTPSESLPNPPSSLSSGTNPISSIQPVPIFYLHQGGQIQHLDLILEKDHQ